MLFVDLLTAYAAAGLVFAAVFVTALAGRIDPAAKDSRWGFRFIILPGAAALWPVLLVKSWQALSPARRR